MKTEPTTRRATADRALIRALHFLPTAASDPEVRPALRAAGFGEADLREGWSLLGEACWSVEPLEPGAPAPPPEPARAPAATREIDAWRSAFFPLARAALGRLHPAQAAFVFGGVAFGRRADAVVAVHVFLDRLDALESGAVRAATREADRAALATLEHRGITRAERARLSELARSADGAAASAPEEEAAAAARRRRAVVALHAWLRDWTACVRTVIWRRDQLRRLGIGRRRASAPEEVTRRQAAERPRRWPEGRSV